VDAILRGEMSGEILHFEVKCRMTTGYWGAGDKTKAKKFSVILPEDGQDDNG
jgi:hypothetical protein